MRTVVADTGPLHYLVLIEQISLLPALFEQVSVPSVVHAELTHRQAPAVVREWAANPPPWLAVPPTPELKGAAVQPALQALDEGERAAIVLASSLQANLILMDDRAGVAVARAAGFRVTGTLGLLDLAARRGWVDLASAFGRLRMTSFRCRPELLDALLVEYRRERGRGC